MYFTTLPDHSQPGFDEQVHFGKFKKHNIIFNALSSNAHCDNHVGCLSFKTVLRGEEWYGVNNRQLVIRPGHFLILNNDQNYSCRIDKDVEARSLSIFFKKEFAASVFKDTLRQEQVSLDNPFDNDSKPPEFFQTLSDIQPELQCQLTSLVSSLENLGYNEGIADEYLIFLLRDLIAHHKSESRRLNEIKAVKTTTRVEIYKRLCVAKDLLHSSGMDKQDLNAIGQAASLSVPQLVRHFKSVFKLTPHQYLMRIRLRRATELLNHSNISVQEIAWSCGFENASAFGRAFKSIYGAQPGKFRKNQMPLGSEF